MAIMKIKYVKEMTKPPMAIGKLHQIREVDAVLGNALVRSGYVVDITKGNKKPLESKTVIPKPVAVVKPNPAKIIKPKPAKKSTKKKRSNKK